MIKFRTIPFILGVSITSLVLFFLFGLYTEHALNEKRERAAEVREEERNAQERLQDIYAEKERQRRRADSLSVLVKAYSDPDVLWTARAMYSETRRPYEMYYVGWVIRNRVEADFRGKEGYKNIILDDKQFSAFNDGYPLRDFYISLEPKYASQSDDWFQAMKTSIEVVESSVVHRPFASDTYHFYSEVSMPPGKDPSWLPYVTRVETDAMRGRIIPKRFRFYRKTRFATNKTSSSSTSTAR